MSTVVKVLEGATPKEHILDFSFFMPTGQAKSREDLVMDSAPQEASIFTVLEPLEKTNRQLLIEWYQAQNVGIKLQDKIHSRNLINAIASGTATHFLYPVVY
ncbi:hypothetical protein RJ640_007632 [Escallonia rubra]|uniref:Uncharacterized protein n=1 Tax=Escallonia rubra TaxID=112253 RepID=A0AA88S0P5_9ASTE|nr:hypothetical protein RJ640_007632 [Escallonia rubra]